MNPLTTIKTLSVTFTETIAPQELECFRGAIVDKVGLDKEWFHNHNNAQERNSNYHYRYPFIQYHLSQGRPRMLFINEAIDEARHFFAQSNWDLLLGERAYKSAIHELKAVQVSFGLLPDMRHYIVRRWIGLNSNNYPTYLATESLGQRIAILERILAGNVISMANAFQYRFPERFQLHITELLDSRIIHYKGVALQAMDIRFSANVALPLGIALGRGGSLGYGRLTQPEKEGVGHPKKAI
ncbi:MAG TPA: CRISPR-associated endonuclease Cas6 [Saprospiraceae bacterium]|nr:CRISPR-associated endonuclease Cas6 [Saprospiraceae bacterium]